MSFHHTLFEGSTHSTRPFHFKGDPYEELHRKKYCTYSPTFPQMVTHFLLNSVTVYNSYFVDNMSFALPNYIKKETREKGWDLHWCCGFFFFFLWASKAVCFSHASILRPAMLWRIIWFIEIHLKYSDLPLMFRIVREGRKVESFLVRTLAIWNGLSNLILKDVSKCKPIFNFLFLEIMEHKHIVIFNNSLDELTCCGFYVYLPNGIYNSVCFTLYHRVKLLNYR